MPWKPHSERAVHSQPCWARISTLLCMLLLIVASCQQAAHDHLGAQRPSGTRAGHSVYGPPASNADAGCPLCAAMHAAPLPEPPTVVRLASSRETAGFTVDLQTASSLWHYAGFSRPPPFSPRLSA